MERTSSRENMKMGIGSNQMLSVKGDCSGASSDFYIHLEPYPFLRWTTWTLAFEHAGKLHNAIHDVAHPVAKATFLWSKRQNYQITFAFIYEAENFCLKLTWKDSFTLLRMTSDTDQR